MAAAKQTAKGYANESPNSSKQCADVYRIRMTNKCSGSTGSSRSLHRCWNYLGPDPETS